MANEMRLIDVNKRMEEIKKANCTNCDNYNGIKCRACWVDDAIGLMDDAPTVDAVEVVRCKDCKHRYTAASGVIFCTQHLTMSAKDNEFCFYGERKDNV